MPEIDLILWGSKPPIAWSLGRTHAWNDQDTAWRENHSSLLERSAADYFFFWDGALGQPPQSEILRLVDQPADIWHAGLALGTAGLPGLIDFVAPTWMLNRDPDPDQAATSWRISWRACLVSRAVIEQIGFWDVDYLTRDAAALSWGHRCVMAGVIPRYVPELAPGPLVGSQLELPFVDELRLVFERFGLKWAGWALGRAVLSGYVRLDQGIAAWRKVIRVPVTNRSTLYKRSFGNKSEDALKSESAAKAVSVLIPTLERYPYLYKLLLQLREQTISPVEIIVIDQTPVDQREKAPYAEFPDLPLRVIFLDHPGQCSSRNAGLQAVQGEYVLFVDDDDEIPPDLIENHLRSLQLSSAQVSCGVADEVGAGPIPAAFTYQRVSDVFPTNNTLIRRDVLRDAGLFDLAYERGQRADGDLGMRIYLSGALMILNPAISVLHHHAPRGGLRTHKARVVTYASSRQQLNQRHLLSVSDLYLALRYFSQRQVQEVIWLSILGTFSLHGPRWQKIVKIILGLVYLPDTFFRLRNRLRIAQRMLEEYPQIPVLKA